MAPSKRRTVLMTAGLSASATVMALNVSMASSASADGDSVVGSPYGDSAVVEVDADTVTPDDAE